MTKEELLAIDWIINGETGTSSKVIFIIMLLGKPPKNTGHPCDPADFRRCRILLDLIPSWRKRLSEMSMVSPVWARMVGSWNELDALYDEEFGQHEAPKLFRRMREIRYAEETA